MARQIVIKLENVWKIYHMGEAKVYALSGIDLTIKRGEFVSIMGPSGSGKCLDGGARISLADGSVATIEDLYKRKELGRKILCFDFEKGKNTASEITDYHRRKDKILEIKTSSGKVIEATKDHPFFTITDSGLAEIRAEGLDGSYVAIPREVRISGKGGQELSTLAKLATEKDVFIADSKKLFRGIVFNRGVRKKICKTLNISPARYDSWMNYSDMPLREFNRIIKLLGREMGEFEKEIRCLKQSNTQNKVKIPHKTSELLLEAYGYVAGDGWVDRCGVRVSNIDKKIKDRIKFIFWRLFEIEAIESVPSRMDINSVTIGHFFRDVFMVPVRQKSRNITLPDFIYSCSEREIGCFLRALFDCDGYVSNSKNEVGITLASKDMIVGLVHLLLRMGIVARYSEVKKRATNSSMEARVYYKLSISGFDNIVKFSEKVGFLIPHKLKRLSEKVGKTTKQSTNVDVVPCTKLIRSTRQALNISLKRIKKRCGKDFWQLEGTNRKPTLKTAEFILGVFRDRLDELKGLKPELKLAKDLGFSKKEVKSSRGVRAYLRDMIERSSILVRELEKVCKVSRYLFWDKVVSVREKRSRIWVYDLTVKRCHNFIANNIFVHNSTMVNMVGCLDVPTRGKILLDGQNIAHLGESELAQIRGQKIGFIFQQFNLIPTLSALENVMLPMVFQGLSFAERKARAIELLETVDLGDRVYHKPTEMSGGEQQRVAIARSLANDPEVLLADEPTGNLDTKTGNMVIDFLEKMHKAGKTIIMVTHDPNIGKKAERTEYLKDGKFV